MIQKYIIGDLVKYQDRIYEIIATINTSYVELKNITETIPVYDVKPIPLTPNILEKNGWKKPKNSGSNHVYYKDELFFTFISKNCKFWFNDLDYGSSICVDLSYVHELQHLLFGLGIDNNIEV